MAKAMTATTTATSQLKPPVRHTTLARTSAVSTAGTVDQTNRQGPTSPSDGSSTGSRPDSPNTEASAMMMTSASAAKNGPTSA